jgi:hypothetical protein
MFPYRAKECLIEEELGKNFSFRCRLRFLMYSLDMASVEVFSLRILEFPNLADLTVMTPFSTSTDSNVKLWTCIGLKPVSLRIEKIKAYFFEPLEIILLICSVVATYGSLPCLRLIGFLHDRPFTLT